MSIETSGGLVGIGLGIASACNFFQARGNPAQILQAVTYAEMAVAAIAIGFAGNSYSRTLGVVDCLLAMGFETWLGQAATGMETGGNTSAGTALIAIYSYTLLLFGLLAGDVMDQLNSP